MRNDLILNAQGIRKYFPVGTGRRFLAKNAHYLHAVDDISIQIRRGEIYGVVGESGSGKSTLGRCLLGLYGIDQGTMEFDGQRIDTLNKEEKRQIRKKMQMVFQNPYSSFDPSKSLGSTFSEVGKVHFMGTERKKFEKRVEELLELMKLPADILNRRPRELSGGQLQRCAILRALLLNPDFIVADEAVSALDVSVQARILNLLMDLREQLGLTILFISHELTVVEHVCDTVAVLYLGAIMEVAPTEELFSHIAHPYTQALLAAKPREHPLEIREDIAMMGEIPSAVDIPEGCRFAGRCRYCQDVCIQQTPRLKEISEGHFAACHFPLYGKNGL